MKINSASSADDVRERIQEYYDLHGFKLGWSYIFGPLSSRNDPCLVTIGLNPGGGRAPHPWEIDNHLAAQSDGSNRNSYFDDPWSKDGCSYTPLQKQIQKMHSEFFSRCLPENILSFQLTPFRSPSWAEFPGELKESALDLGIELLDWTLALVSPATPIVAFGVNPVRHRIMEWFGSGTAERVPTGWGKVCAEVCNTTRGNRLIFLPHLSRYQIFGRAEFVNSAKLFGASQ